MEQLNNYLALNTAESLFLVPFEEIIFVKSDGSYTYVIGEGEKQWELSKPMAAFQLLFENNNFCRIHRSYLVNVRHIRRLDKSEKILYMVDGRSIPYSKPGYQALMQFFKDKGIAGIQSKFIAKLK